MFKKKNLMSLGLAGLMAAMSVSSAFAASGDAYGSAGENSVENVEYYDEAEYADAWTGVDGAATEVLVSRASSFTVIIPEKIVLEGSKDADNKADYNVTVTADMPGDAQINVVPNTASKTILDGSATQEDNFADGSGTFAMLEAAGIKNNITATIEQADTSWTVEDDGTDDVIDAVAKAGKVSVADLTAGEWSNTINFDISVVEK